LRSRRATSRDPEEHRQDRRHAGQRPDVHGADFYNRRLFNDLFFVRYKGESEDRLRCLAQELFDTVLRPSIFPARTS
jgi:hypothetical protein